MKAYQYWSSLNNWDKFSFWLAIACLITLAVFFIVMNYATCFAAKKIAIYNQSKRNEKNQDILKITHTIFEREMIKKYQEKDIS